MALYYNGHKVKNLYFNGKCITRLALGKGMTRLVEGDDFVRAEWLCKYIADTSSESDYSNKAVIDTGVAFDDAILISSKIDNSDLVDNAAIGVFDVVNNYSIGVGAVSQTLNFLIVSGPNNHRVTSSVTTFKVSKKGFEINGIPYHNSSVVTLSSNISIAIGALKYTSEYYGNLYRYTTGSYQNKNNGTVKYGALTIYDGNTVVADFIPVRLLRPIHATLDANGIARNAGVCGMYNSVNGLFYGNVENDGTFTVEPSLVESVDYERHKWLVGDGSAYLYLGEVSNYIEFDADIPQADIQFRFVYGYNGALRVYRANQVFSALVDANKIKNCNTPLQSKIKIDLDTHFAYSNGEAFAHTDLGADTNGESAFKSAFFFGNDSPTTSVFRGKCAIGNVDMDGNVFTPIRLLRPLPAYLDANGKARAQYECGMLDLKTMKFYGNVASSGNFTVSDN